VVQEKSAAASKWQQKAKDAESKLVAEQVTFSTQQKEYVALVSFVQGPAKKPLVSCSISRYVYLLPWTSAHNLQFAGILGAEVEMNEVSSPYCMGP
jgi:hypothetical protein